MYLALYYNVIYATTVVPFFFKLRCRDLKLQYPKGAGPSFFTGRGQELKQIFKALKSIVNNVNKCDSNGLNPHYRFGTKIAKGRILKP